MLFNFLPRSPGPHVSMMIMLLQLCILSLQKPSYFLSWSSASPLIILTSNPTSTPLHMLLSLPPMALPIPNSSNSCPSLLVKLPLILQNPAQRFPLGSPVPSTVDGLLMYLFFLRPLYSRNMSVSLSRLRALRSGLMLVSFMSTHLSGIE